MKKLLSAILKNMGTLAIMMVVLSANSTCIWATHQPQIPK